MAVMNGYIWASIPDLFGHLGHKPLERNHSALN
jgi:hypothetical protein